MLYEKKVLVFNDNPSSLHDLKIIFDFLGEHSVYISDPNWGDLKSSNTSPPDEFSVVVLGQSEPKANLHKHLESIHRYFGVTPVILVGNYEEVDPLWDPYLRHMVIARLSLPITYNDLVDALHRAQRLNEAKAHGQTDPLRPSHLFRSLVGTSRDVQSVRTMMGQVAEKDVTVLIEGESGTGKEVVARNLHYHSARRDGPFVPVNCGAIPAELLESELFGHEKGAFTGAINSRAGRFEMAEAGTLFLDEIGDMPLHMQVKILRVIQEKSYERVGGNKTFNTNVRIIAATHRNLEKMIEEGKFREDLYYRLNVFPIEMPSLRDRAEDIPLLINELVNRLESENRGTIRFNSAAILSLCRHSWPGNVRELANLVERMAIMHPYGVVGVQDLPTKYRHVETLDDEDSEFETMIEEVNKPTVVSSADLALLPEKGIDLKEYITGLEQSLIKQALDNCGGVVARAAEQLMIRRTTLVEKMRKYGLQRN